MGTNRRRRKQLAGDHHVKNARYVISITYRALVAIHRPQNGRSSSSSANAPGKSSKSSPPPAPAFAFGAPIG